MLVRRAYILESDMVEASYFLVEDSNKVGVSASSGVSGILGAWEKDGKVVEVQSLGTSGAVVSWSSILVLVQFLQ